MVLFCGCGGEKTGGSDAVCSSTDTVPVINDRIVVHLLANPDNLNPTNTASAEANYILANIFESLTEQSGKEPYDMIPVLAVKVGEMAPDGLSIRYELHPQARWPDGSAVTAEDVLFSYKIYRIPEINCAHARPYFDAITDIVVAAENPRVITFKLKEKYILTETTVGGAPILPRKVYDPGNVLAKYSFAELVKMPVAELKKRQDLSDFAKEYNSVKYQREKGGIVGSGPYEFVEWITGQQIVLRRKKNWWADSVSKVKGGNNHYHAWPAEIVYRIIPDQTTALAEMKAGNLDLIAPIRPKDFAELEKDGEMKKRFTLAAYPQLSYEFIAMNCRPPANRTPFFTDVKVRRAMAHLFDVDKALKIITYGYAQRITTPILPFNKDSYLPDLLPPAYNPKLAAELLDSAGWKDSNGNGTRDKMIGGKLVEFECDFAISTGNTVRKQAAQLFAADAQKLGIKVNIVSIDPAVMPVKIQQELQFDLIYYGLVNPLSPAFDLKQVFHTAYHGNGGSNFYGFGDQASDRLIDSIRQELDKEKRNGMYKTFQRYVYDWQPSIFLWNRQNLMAVSSRFRGFVPTLRRPGYIITDFWVPKGCEKYQLQ